MVNIKSVQYAPSPVPTDPAQLPAYLDAEFRRVAQVVQMLAAGHMDRVYKAPDKPRDGDWRFADGSSWDPGSGKGFYRFDGDTNTWIYLG